MVEVQQFLHGATSVACCILSTLPFFRVRSAATMPKKCFDRKPGTYVPHLSAQNNGYGKSSIKKVKATLRRPAASIAQCTQSTAATTQRIVGLNDRSRNDYGDYMGFMEPGDNSSTLMRDLRRPSWMSEEYASQKVYVELDTLNCQDIVLCTNKLQVYHGYSPPLLVLWPRDIQEVRNLDGIIGLHDPAANTINHYMNSL